MNIGGPPPDDIPESPWASRFTRQQDSRNVFTWDNLKHSGFAPEGPRVNDPIYFLDTTGFLDQAENPVVPSNKEMDRILRTENYQRYKLRGMWTWQANTLYRWVNFGPPFGSFSGGHVSRDDANPPSPMKTVFDRSKVKVDDTRWYKFFHKDRWYDWIQTSPPATTSGLLWTVDDPRVWGELSFCLELADRALKAFIEDRNPFVRTFGSNNVYKNWEDVLPEAAGFQKPPFDGARVILDLATEREVAKAKNEPFRFQHIAEMSKDQWTQRLEELLSTYKWSFIDDEKLGAEALDFNPVGAMFTGICLLNSKRLTMLLGDSITLAERCQMYYNMLVSIVHELTHGIVAARIQNNLPGRVRPNIGRGTSEPFINFYGVNEIGHMMESYLFGGSTIMLPVLYPIPLAVATYKMPCPLFPTYNWVPGAWSERGAPIEATYIPTSWTSKLVSEAFWNDETVPRKSADFFHRPTIFTSTTPYSMGAPWQAVDPDPDDDTLVAMTDDETMVLDTWNERHELWDNIRAEWYDFEKFKWDQSPWALIEWRVKIDRFEAAFAQRDEVTCARIATNLTHCINWSVDRATYLRYLPRDRRDVSPWWVIHCIGLLMMASMPIRTQKITKISSVADTPVTFTAAPSLKAAAAGHINTVYINMPVRQEEPFDIDRSLFYNQVRQTGEKVNGITQMDYLELISDVLREITVYAPMYAVWLGSIMAAQTNLFKDRRAIRTQYSGAHIARWSSTWLFEVPEYNQQIIRVADNTQYEMNWNRNTEGLEYGRQGRTGDGWAHMIPRP